MGQAMELTQYEDAADQMQPPTAMREWSEEQAREAAKQAFHNAPRAIADASVLAHARREARHALTGRRLAGIRRRHPDLAAVIDSDFDWFRQFVVGFDRWSVREQVSYWYMITGVPEAGPSIGSTRGTSATWPGVRDAAFVLLDWYSATRGKEAPSGWLATSLVAIEPALTRLNANGVARERKVAREMIVAWRVRRA